MSRRILVIDDDSLLLSCIVRYLSVAGHSAITADDGHKGEQLAQTELPDLVLLDMRMPGRSGMTTLAALQDSPVTRRIPVVMLSGCDDDFGLARRAGAALTLLKPFSCRELHDAIAKVFETAESTCQRAEL